VEFHLALGVCDWVGVEMLDTAGVEGGRAADYAVDFVAFLDQELGQVGAVLACDACD